MGQVTWSVCFGVRKKLGERRKNAIGRQVENLHWSSTHYQHKQRNSINFLFAPRAASRQPEFDET